MPGHRVRGVIGAWMVVIPIGLFPPSLHAQESRIGPAARRERHAVHLVTIKPQDRKFMEALDGAVLSLKDGHETVILFDGNSVTWLRVHMQRQKKTLLHDAEIAGQEHQALAERLGVSLSDAPRNYLEYVQHLAKAGAKVVANRNAIRQYGLAEHEIHPVATLISVEQISDILDRSDLCFTVGGS